MTQLSIVVPAYNEATRITEGLAKLVAALGTTDAEIIVVDDGSTDATITLAERALEHWPKASVINLGRNVGKGAAVKAGVVEATGASILFLDADMATDLSSLTPLVAALDMNHVVIGSRSHDDSSVERRPRARSLMNVSSGLLVTTLTSLPYMDTQCGFKGFRGPVAKLLFHGLTIDRFGFDVQLLDTATRLGLTIGSIPVKWSDIEGSHVVPWRHGIETAWDVLWMKTAWGKVPPVLGVNFPGASIEDVEDRHGAALTSTDLRVTRAEGAAVLFPAVPPEEAARRIREILDVSVAEGTSRLAIDYRSLLAPRFGTFQRPVEIGL